MLSDIVHSAFAPFEETFQSIHGSRVAAKDLAEPGNDGERLGKAEIRQLTVKQLRSTSETWDSGE